jgi:hypothetical protein
MFSYYLFIMKKLERPFRVNEAVVRGVALQVMLLSLWAVLSLNRIPLYILAGDFAIRVFLVPFFSPLAFVSKRMVVPVFRFKKKMIIFQPKRFAAMIGLTLSAAALVLTFTGNTVAAIIFLSLLGIFSALECFLKFCAGCKIFGLLMRWGLVDEELCSDCVFSDGGGI